MSEDEIMNWCDKQKVLWDKEVALSQERVTLISNQPEYSADKLYVRILSFENIAITVPANYIIKHNDFIKTINWYLRRRGIKCQVPEFEEEKESNE